MTNIETRRRIVALVIAAATLLALGWLAVRPAETLAVPDGARPGSMTLRECDYETEAGKLAADCGTLVVPENRRDLETDLIALPVIRIRATGAEPREPVFRLGGGPGNTNLTFPQASRLTERHDVVLVGYRGVDGSRRLDCPEVTGMHHTSSDLAGRESQPDIAKAFGACAERLTKDGVDLTGYSAAQRVDDFEAARTAFGYGRINLLSSSAGTRTAMIYAWRHPASLLRSAMVSVNPPGHMMWDPRITDSQFQQYADLCRADERCSDRTPDLAASMRSAAADIPQRWGPFRVKDGNVRAAGMFAMHNNGPGSAPLNAPMLIDAYLSGGGASWAVSVLGDAMLPGSIVWGEFASFSMLDAPAARSFYAAGGDPGSTLGNAGSEFHWGGPTGYATRWPDSPDNEEYRTVRRTDVETLLVSGSVDFSTPAELATKELLPALDRGRQVILPDLGHTADFYERPDASKRLLTAFFDDGTVDDSGFGTRPVDFHPGPLSMSTIATALLAVTIGGVLLALGLLAGMARRVRRRGGFTTAGPWLRVLTPLPLGLGGWFLAVLLSWTIGPNVYVAGAVTVIPFAGVAVGLGAYLAWTSRDLPASRRRLALALAVGASLAGAIVGFGAASGFVTPLTAIAGAAAAANLALLLLGRSHSTR